MTGAWLGAIFVVLALAPGATGAPRQRQGIQIKVLGCVTANSEVAARRGCHTVPGVSRENESPNGLAGADALLLGGSSLYAVGNMDSTITQLVLGSSPGAISFGACLTGDSFVDVCTNVAGAQSNAFQSPIADPTAAAISPDGRSLYVTSGDFHGAAVARFSRDPISGNLTYEDCLSGDRGAGPAGTGACSLIPDATADGYGSGLDEPSGIAISSSGRFLYVTAALDQSIATFERNPANGALTYKECISSNRQASGCQQLPGGETVLDEITAPTLSSDGRFLSTAATRAGTVDSFAVHGSGAISYLGCLSGNKDSHECGRSRATTGGPYTLQAPAGITESSDGRFLYVSSSFGSIVVLKRGRASGRLAPSSCISGFTSDRGRCTLVPKARRLADGSPLYGVHTPTISRNGKILLAAVRGEDGVTELRRNPHSGALAFRGCATGNLRLSTAGSGVCTKLPGATQNGIGSGFYKTGALVQGPGNLLYASAPRDATVSVLRP